jgi:hypothetical protein
MCLALAFASVWLGCAPEAEEEEDFAAGESFEPRPEQPPADEAPLELEEGADCES